MKILLCNETNEFLLPKQFWGTKKKANRIILKNNLFTKIYWVNQFGMIPDGFKETIYHLQKFRRLYKDADTLINGVPFKFKKTSLNDDQLYDWFNKTGGFENA